MNSQLAYVVILISLCIGCASNQSKLCENSANEKRIEYIESNQNISAKIINAIKAQGITVGMSEEQLLLSVGVANKCESIVNYSPFLLPKDSWLNAFQPTVWPTTSDYGVIITKGIYSQTKSQQVMWARFKHNKVVEHGIGNPMKK